LIGPQFSSCQRRYNVDKEERFHFYDAPPEDDCDMNVDDGDTVSASGPFSSIFPRTLPEIDVRSGRDAWQTLFGPPKKRDSMVAQETEAGT
jgi:hypothetical protein